MPGTEPIGHRHPPFLWGFPVPLLQRHLLSAFSASEQLTSVLAFF